MNYLSICSGIEAASVAWKPMGWNAVGFSEIEPFPCSLLNHHYPGVRNYGDMTNYNEWSIDGESVDLVCGGTPCQSFSVAGLRKGLDDPRGNLALVFLGIVDRFKPRWVLWENVPGVLSDKGNAFGQFVTGLSELGYGVCYRILDAQNFGVPQRRRRVWVVGYFGNGANVLQVPGMRGGIRGQLCNGGEHIGASGVPEMRGGKPCGVQDWRPSAAVLFERESLRRDLTPRRKTRERIAGSIAPSLTGSGRGVERCGESRGQDPVIPVAPPLRSNPYCDNASHENGLVCSAVTSKWAKGTGGPSGDECQNLVTAQQVQWSSGGGQLMNDTAQALRSGAEHNYQFVAEPVVTGPTKNVSAFGVKRAGGNCSFEITPTLDSGGGGGFGNGMSVFGPTMRVRRLTTRECERLQGFPDDYTLIPHKGKPASDSARYKAIGNSWAVPCARWIGERIQMVEDVLNK